MSDEMMYDVMQLLQSLLEVEEEDITRVTVMECLRQIIQDEWIRTGVLVPVDGEEE